MTYDLQIFKEIPGLVSFERPSNVTNGMNKLLQRVVIFLFADNGELINYTGGSANAQSLTEEIMTRETARVTEALKQNSLSNDPDNEKIGELVLSLLKQEGSRVTLDISVTSADADTSSIIINI